MLPPFCWDTASCAGRVLGEPGLRIWKRGSPLRFPAVHDTHNAETE